MKNEKYHTVGTVPKTNRKIIERGKIDIVSHKNMTAYFPGQAYVLQYRYKRLQNTEGQYKLGNLEKLATQGTKSIPYYTIT